MFRKITLLRSSVVAEKFSMICIFTGQHNRGHLIFRVEKRKQNERMMWTKGAYLVYSSTAPPRLQCSPASNPPYALWYNILTRSRHLAPCRHRRTAPGHGLFSFELTLCTSWEVRLIDFFCGLVVMNGSGHFPTRWHPTNLAWLPSLKRQHSILLQLQGGLEGHCSVVPCRALPIQ